MARHRLGRLAVGDKMGVGQKKGRPEAAPLFRISALSVGDQSGFFVAGLH